MKWKSKVKQPSPVVGQMRYVWVFAILPHRCTDGITRWLEPIMKVQKYESTYDMDGGGYTGWETIRCESLESAEELR